MKKSPIERFWSHVKIVEDDDSCWEWVGAYSPRGYGMMRIDGKTVKASRFSYELHNDPIPQGKWVLHKCDNRKCVRPNHLFLGTSQDNIDDKVNKGRAAFKLTELAVKEIRESNETPKGLADKFKISISTIYRVKNRIYWGHVK